MPPAAFERAAEVFRVLAHPVRLQIVERLDLREPRTVGDLADELGLPHAACSQHLNLMRVHGLVERTRSGRESLYAIADPRAVVILNCIRAHSPGAPDAPDA
ncbi:MAG: ArsR/SmtB family transcription factor [Phycisphaerales bacterium]